MSGEITDDHIWGTIAGHIIELFNTPDRGPCSRIRPHLSTGRPIYADTKTMGLGIIRTTREHIRDPITSEILDTHRSKPRPTQRPFPERDTSQSVQTID